MRVGVDQITHSKDLIAIPINLGSSELISINDLVSMVEDIAGVKLARTYDLNAPKAGRGNSDNAFIRQVLDWEPLTPCAPAWRRPMPGSPNSTPTAKPAGAS